MTKEAKIYESGNSFQKRAYRKMANYLHARGISQFGRSVRGTPYRHLLPVNSTIENFLYDNKIASAAEARFSNHKAGDWDRARFNTTASQPCCFNLFVPLQQDTKLANYLFSTLFNAPVNVHHIEIEFTPNTKELNNLPGFERSHDKTIGDETIGDQGKFAGTDADVAIFYSIQDRKGVLLIEFKYIEAEFSQCTSYKNKPKKSMQCTSPNFYNNMIKDPLYIKGRPACGYLQYQNWHL